MRAFHLLCDDDDLGGTTRIDFQAESPDFALQIAQGQAAGRDMQLFEGTTLLGTLSKSTPHLWRLT